MKFIKKAWTTILLIVIFIIGLCLLLYPTVSDMWNSVHQSRAIAHYVEDIASIDTEEYDRMIQAAVEYNEKLQKNVGRWLPNDKDQHQYRELLNINNTGMMGYIEIPKINVSLPIYHGTDEGVLQIAVGHIEGSSLPIGGPSTHCVISGHRGLPSAKLFSDLDDLIEGDTFVMRIMNEILTYEVDQILIVEPDDISSLDIVAGEDYCTLVTCTPYGVNTHRLLVRGHRTENEMEASSIRVTSDAIKIETIVVAPLLAIPILILLIGGVLYRSGKENKRRNLYEKIVEEEQTKYSRKKNKL